MFRDLIESIRLEARTKEQQRAGLAAQVPLSRDDMDPPDAGTKLARGLRKARNTDYVANRKPGEGISRARTERGFQRLRKEFGRLVK